MARTYVCSTCGFAIEAWDEGNPYFLSDKGKPQYFYHPNEGQLREYLAESEGRYLTGEELQCFLEQRTGNKSDMLCLDCGREFKRDLVRE